MQIDVRSVRKSLGETQAAFAERFGVNTATVHRWEKFGLPKHGAARHAVEKLSEDVEGKCS
jgi:DNA-binding transcriptional regulator YiaG